jgi:hypothetical protein
VLLPFAFLFFAGVEPANSLCHGDAAATFYCVGGGASAGGGAQQIFGAKGALPLI